MFPVSGHCLCGQVRVTLKAPPQRMAQCHCRDCQRLTGTGHSANALFKTEDVTVDGETCSFTVTADSGNVLTRHFCATCGSRAYGVNSGRPGMLNVPPGLFDDNAWFNPQILLYAHRRPGWDHEHTEIPAFDGMPPAPPE